MDHDLAVAHRIADALVALDVSLDQIDVGEHLEQVLAASRREVIEDAHVVTVPQHAVDGVRANEPAPTRDEDPQATPDPGCRAPGSPPLRTRPAACRAGRLRARRNDGPVAAPPR